MKPPKYIFIFLITIATANVAWSASERLPGESFAEYTTRIMKEQGMAQPWEENREATNRRGAENASSQGSLTASEESQLSQAGIYVYKYNLYFSSRSGAIVVLEDSTSGQLRVFQGEIGNLEEIQILKKTQYRSGGIELKLGDNAAAAFTFVFKSMPSPFESNDKLIVNDRIPNEEAEIETVLFGPPNTVSITAMISALQSVGLSPKSLFNQNSQDEDQPKNLKSNWKIDATFEFYGSYLTVVTYPALSGTEHRLFSLSNGQMIEFDISGVSASKSMPQRIQISFLTASQQTAQLFYYKGDGFLPPGEKRFGLSINGVDNDGLKVPDRPVTIEDLLQAGLDLPGLSCEGLILK